MQMEMTRDEAILTALASQWKWWRIDLDEDAAVRWTHGSPPRGVGWLQGEVLDWNSGVTVKLRVASGSNIVDVAIPRTQITKLTRVSTPHVATVTSVAT